MDKIMDKLRENPRLVVATLITAGIAALIIGSSGDSNDNQTTDVVEGTAQTQASEETASDEVMEKKEDDTIGSEPTSGPVTVEKNETKLKAVVRTGDNQTVIVRQMVNDFLKDQSKSLGAEQRLFVETVVVNSLPRNDIVNAGDEISVEADTISTAVADSAELTEAQLALWAQYL